MRQLASIQKIINIQPIPDADAIERADVLGWHVVTKKGEFRIGDLVIYLEIDSMLPIRPEFEFLRKCCYRAATVHDGRTIVPEGFRLRTVRLRGQVSQGLIVPLDVLPADVPIEEGANVTEALDVGYYDLDALRELSETVHGHLGFRIRPPRTFPSFIPRTDETRIQSAPGVLERHRGTRMIATEKLDGSSITIFTRGGEIGICSRNHILDQDDSTNPMIAWAIRANVSEGMTRLREAYGRDVAFQGEFIGPNVQGNKYGLRGHDVRIFSAFDIECAEYVNAFKELTRLTDIIGLKTVPIVYRFELDHTVDGLVAIATGPSTLANIPREGIVIRPEEEGIADPKLGRLSFKVINPEFLLRHPES